MHSIFLDTSIEASGFGVWGQQTSNVTHSLPIRVYLVIYDSGYEMPSTCFLRRFEGRSLSLSLALSPSLSLPLSLSLSLSLPRSTCFLRRFDRHLPRLVGRGGYAIYYTFCPDIARLCTLEGEREAKDLLAWTLATYSLLEGLVTCC